MTERPRGLPGWKVVAIVVCVWGVLLATLLIATGGSMPRPPSEQPTSFSTFVSPAPPYVGVVVNVVATGAVAVPLSVALLWGYARLGRRRDDKRRR